MNRNSIATVDNFAGGDCSEREGSEGIGGVDNCSERKVGGMDTMSSDYTIPSELQELLLDFTVHYLVEQPPDIITFAMDYFNNLHQKRVADSNGGHSDDESMITDEDGDIDEPVYHAAGRRKSVFAEAYNPEDDDSAADQKVIHPKTDAQRVQLSEAVKPVLLFRSLDFDQLADILDAMFERKVEENEFVITQGDDGDNFYVVGSGVYNIILDTPSGLKTVGKYDNSGSFGELALLYNMPRAASIQAVTPGQLWCMERATFRRIILRSAYQKRKMYESLLSAVPLLTHLDDNERMNLADALASQKYNNGEKIIKQGDPADGMYFMESGRADVIVNNNGDEKMVREYNKGDYFGELALITHKPRAATICAKDNVRVAFLDVLAFERLLGPCMEIMMRSIDDYEDQLVKLFGSKVNISELKSS